MHTQLLPYALDDTARRKILSTHLLGYTGPLLGENPPYTGGAALLFRDGEPGAPPHLAYIEDSGMANEIWLAESPDGFKWTAVDKTWMLSRPDCWDKFGVAPWPQPSRLATGDYLMIYNFGTGFPFHPNPLRRCAIGWVVLDGADPTIIVARSEVPLLIAPYETCKQPECQVPMVVFAMGLKPLGKDEFLVVYGGADTFMGVSRIYFNSTIKIVR